LGREFRAVVFSNTGFWRVQNDVEMKWKGSEKRCKIQKEEKDQATEGRADLMGRLLIMDGTLLTDGFTAFGAAQTARLENMPPSAMPVRKVFGMVES
jgi:hypothetical protein